jgi:hydroxyacylglutathione hydrolase
MNADQPARPANLANIVAINQGHRPLTMEEPAAPGLPVAAFAARAAEGAVVVDTRSTAAFGGGHVPGAYHVHLTNAEFEQRVGWITPPDVPVLLMLDKDADIARALHALAFVGLDRRVQGYLAGGIGAWMAAGRPLETLPQMTVHQLHEQLRGGNGLRTLDVREPSEFAAGHLAGARFMSYKHVAWQADQLDLDPGEPIAVVCEGGVRSSTACSLLLRRGYRNLRNVIGGMAAWTAAGLPLEKASRR